MNNPMLFPILMLFGVMLIALFFNIMIELDDRQKLSQKKRKHKTA